MTFHKSLEAEPRATSSPRLLEEEETPGPLSQQLRATSSSSEEEHLSSHVLFHGALVAAEYLPFFRTYGRLLAEEELALQPEICRDHEGGQSHRGVPCPEDSALPTGFFPYYRSKEESFPSLALPSQPCMASQAHPTRWVTAPGCFCRMTVKDRCPAASAGMDGASGPSHSPACCSLPLLSAGCSHDRDLDTLSRGHASEFVPFYRALEEGLCTSPGPPTSALETQGPTGGMHRPGAGGQERQAQERPT
ncbi:uncharacterized protein LOC102473686 [Tupaia chinensis]|uniref:uncharacterized protein LOC102473686 n=1 Tax=Tupaia chinensis TaxID=246437 RepID=UPI000FFBEDFB|nr:uncharacterized protein LOC102473686 [Tupaia chinensis]